ncbi:hypothetical protein CF326_g7280, partial [Tilletia indica]
SIPSNPTLPTASSWISGNGVVKWASTDKKEVIITGLTFLGVTIGWAIYTIRCAFEEGMRFKNWQAPGPRALVTFDAVINKAGDDGMIHCYLRRITQIDNAAQTLLSALDIGKSAAGTGEKAALLRDLRENAAKRVKIEPPDSKPATTPVPSSAQAVELSTPTVPNPIRHGRVDETPPSPSPAPGRNKRGRQE